MKRTVPLLITAVVGFVLVGSAFIPAAESWGEKALIWFDLLAGIAFILGGGNLVGAQLKKISTRRPGWGYAAVTLVAFLVTLGVGVFKMGVRPAPNQEFYGQSFAELPPGELPLSSLPAAIPEQDAELSIPASSRRQVSLGDGVINVRGWLSASQLADLADAGDTLAWKCMVERLGALARPPTEFRGRLLYYADHGALSFAGMMTPEDEAALKQLNPESSSFAAAVDVLAEKSRRRSAVIVPEPPPGFAMPSGMASRATLDNGTLTYIGPMSPSERDLLSRGAMQSRIAFPLDEAAQTLFVAEELGGAALNEPQQAVVDRILSLNWSGDLVAAINTAGVAKPGTKTPCELLAERESGVTELDPVVPAGASVELNAAQIGHVEGFVSGNDHDWAALVERLKSAGPLTDSQVAAITEFSLRLPTIGQRNREIWAELVKLVAADDEAEQNVAPPARLNAAQRDALLDDFRAEFNWRQAIERLFIASHQVKYSWSGEFNQQGSPFWWLFEYVFQPIQSMMFALLAFYVASAAFRAFRAKNLEAILLLGTAFIILLGRTYAGMLVTDWLPKESPLRLENLSVDIMRVFNAAGNRAIMIGIALGIASTSLKILLGIDRSHTGGKD